MSQSEISDYLTQVGRHPVLTREAQLRHCQRIHAWINHENGRLEAPVAVRKLGARSMEVMVRTNLRLVISIAKRYQGRGMDMADLIQEGNLGLIRGLELFDPKRGYSITTYAYWWIRQAITRSIHTHARSIRLPINTHEILSRAQRFVTEQTTKNGQAPSIEEIAAFTGVSPERVLQVLDHHAMTTCSSLDSVNKESENSLLTLISDPTIPDAYTALIVDSNRDMVRGAMKACLNEVEAQVLHSVFYHGSTFSALAEGMSCSRARVGQIHYAALNKLRAFLIGNGHVV